MIRLLPASTFSPQSPRHSSLNPTILSKPRLSIQRSSSTSSQERTCVPRGCGAPPFSVARPCRHYERELIPPPRLQINDSLKHFGLSPSTTSLLLVHLAPSEDAGGPEADEVLPRMEAIVEGEVQSLDLLGALPQGGTNYKALRKVSQPWFREVLCLATQRAHFVRANCCSCTS